jgi:hypothetical protein
MVLERGHSALARINEGQNKKENSVALSPRANYTD